MAQKSGLRSSASASTNPSSSAKYWRMTVRAFALLAVSIAAAACRGTPSDDPAQYTVNEAQHYRVEVSPPRWLFPSAALPKHTATLASNNNVDLAFHDGRLFLAWRTSETHFASANTRLYVMSSAD